MIGTAYRAPKRNAPCERLIGTLRRQLPDHVIVMGERHARRLMTEYADFYNAERCHQALCGDPPSPGLRRVSGRGELVGRPVQGFGTHRRAAAGERGQVQDRPERRSGEAMRAQDPSDPMERPAKAASHASIGDEIHAIA